MSNCFKREDRYLVIKRKDIESALNEQQKMQLFYLARLVEADRLRRGKSNLECVVVESDWTNYQEVWRTVEAVERGSYSPYTMPCRLSAEGDSNKAAEDNKRLCRMLKRAIKVAKDQSATYSEIRDLSIEARQLLLLVGDEETILGARDEQSH